MCGIVAIARPGGLHAHERGATLQKMRDAIAHRGPDDASVAVRDGWVGLGHRRLAVIDLTGSRQPLHDERGEIACVFNGEIYNYRALRERLTALGHVFATNGDGEVIVHAYEEWGPDAAASLEGMFAFILVDRARQRVIAARDRFGIKPLFWTRAGGAVLLGSELKALLAHPAVARTANRLALELGTMRLHVPWPLTAFDGIYRVPPGALLEIGRRGTVSLRRHARLAGDPPDAGDPPLRRVVDRATVELERAVARQMVADVPVGAFLSGGIDSSLVVTLMTRLTREKIHTFSIRTRRPDESRAAAETARRLGTTHHTVDLAELPFEGLERLPALYDEPFAETSALGVLALSLAARDHVKVALSGDGGDEVFGGYDSYRWIRNASHAPSLPRGLALRVHGHLQRLAASRTWPRRVRHALQALSLAVAEPMSAQRELTTHATDDPLYLDAEHLNARIDDAAAQSLSQLGPARQAMAADRLARLPDAMLNKVDVASMAASLEVRVPLLDDALVRFADSVQERHLVGMWRGKLLLRRVLSRLLPGPLAWQKKRGFSLPLGDWLRSRRTSRHLTALFGERKELLGRLTGLDVEQAWRRFRTDETGGGPAADQLLWMATVALWADRFGVADANRPSLDSLPIA